MSRYRLTIDAHHHAAEISVQNQKFSCEIDGQTVTGQILHSTPPTYVIRLEDGRILTCDITTQGTTSTVTCNGQTWPMGVSEIYGESIENGEDGSAAEMRAPMPGRIVAVAAAAGTEVKRGDPVIIIEAMKMQNAIVAPSAGTIQIVHVKPGDAVEAGQLLATIG